MRTYLDTSAAMKLIVEEAESTALLDELETGDHALVASWLLHAELHCAAGRRPEAVPPEAAHQVLATVTLVDLIRGDLLAAGTHAPLRTNDALHLATALRVSADAMLTYDEELARAARNAGLAVVQPT